MLRILMLLLTAAGLALAQGVVTAVIESGQSLSGAVELKPQGRSGFCTAAVMVMPSAWTAADVTFQGSIDGSTFGNLYDDAGVEVVVKAAASRVVVLPAAYFWGLRWIRVRSGTSAAPVTQTAQRSITILCRE
jgi:hypothetical protein